MHRIHTHKKVTQKESALWFCEKNSMSALWWCRGEIHNCRALLQAAQTPAHLRTKFSRHFSVAHGAIEHVHSQSLTHEIIPAKISRHFHCKRKRKLIWRIFEMLVMAIHPNGSVGIIQVWEKREGFRAWKQTMLGGWIRSMPLWLWMNVMNIMLNNSVIYSPLTISCSIVSDWFCQCLSWTSCLKFLAMYILRGSVIKGADGDMENTCVLTPGSKTGMPPVSLTNSLG